MHNGTWWPGMSLEVLEKQQILGAYAFYRNKTAAASMLGIAIRTLDSKLERYAQEEEETNARLADADRARAEHLQRARGIHPAQFDTATGKTASYEANAGHSVQSAAKPATEQPMPLPQRQEIQSVLPRHAAQGGNGKRR